MVENIWTLPSSSVIVKLTQIFTAKKKRNHSKNSNSTATVLNSVCKIKNKDK